MYSLCNNEIIDKINMNFVDITFIINDIYSFKKEYNDNYFMNLVYIIHKEEEYDINISITKCINKLEKLFLKFERNVNKNIDFNLDKYVIGIRYWISGFIFWSKISKRYN